MVNLFRAKAFRYGTLLGSGVALTLMLCTLGPRLLSTGPFMPHATCYLQDPAIIWLHVSTDLLIWLAYVSIASTLAYMVYRARADIPFHWMFLSFGTFIIACGFTHLMEVITVWNPVYWLAGGVKIVTAVASVTTAVAMFPLVPKVFQAIGDVRLAEQRRLQIETAHRELQEAHERLAKHQHDLEVANRDLEMFAHSVAHDLKAPARTVAGFCDILRQEHAGSLNDEARDLMLRTSRAAHRMDLLLNDLLKYATVSRTNIESELIPLETAVQDAIALVEGARASHDALIQVQTDAMMVRANRGLLVQALVNLLTNALKYSKSGARPEVVLRAIRRNEMVRVLVEDNGIGITAEGQKKIFNLFVRLHGDNAYEGSGIGLAVVRRAAERMKGQVGVQSDGVTGSTFWIDLPAA